MKAFRAWSGITGASRQQAGVCGLGRLCQRRGGPIEIIRPGDRVFFEPGEDHWHGTHPTRMMTHLAMVQLDEDGNGATWGDHVRTTPRRPSSTTSVDPGRKGAD